MDLRESLEEASIANSVSECSRSGAGVCGGGSGRAEG